MKKLAIAIIISMSIISVFAEGVIYKDGDKYVKIGGRIQLQYHQTDKNNGDTKDKLLIRRLRPAIEGSVHKDWKGKIQFDFGKNNLAIKDAYFQYTGFDWVNITIGNASFCFSRELLTSSKYQQFIERTFVGDHNNGTPDRQTGIHLQGKLFDKKLVWSAAVTKAAIDPDNDKLDFDTVIQHDAGNDWIEGNMIGGRLEFFPLGLFKASQGNFSDGELKTAFAVGVFHWNSDDDLKADDTDIDSPLATHKEIDSVIGLEFSGALRVAGLSLDAQYNRFNANLAQSGIIDGIYKNSKTTLSNYSVEGGYMVVPSKLELVGGYQSQNADGYEKAWNKTSIGFNYFVKKHDIKYQLTYQIGENKNGKKGNGANEIYIQTQYVF